LKLNATNKLTGRHTYKNDFTAGQRTTLQTRQPNASCFNFFAPVQNILKFFGSRTNGTFGFAPTAQADPSAKPKEPFFSNALLTITSRILTLTITFKK